MKHKRIGELELWRLSGVLTYPFTPTIGAEIAPPLNEPLFANGEALTNTKI